MHIISDIEVLEFGLWTEYLVLSSALHDGSLIDVAITLAHERPSVCLSIQFKFVRPSGSSF